MIARVEVRGLPATRSARLRADQRVAAAIAALPPRVTSARVVFSDVNGAKGGLDMRCAITVNLSGRRRLHVEDLATTPRQALDGALAKLDRRMLRTEESDRDSRRRPKKYYAASRVTDKGA
ncbi:MAG TPA: HPF/RaiA family ribosome-associated protein [Candidatus Acidoferrum sp.]|jgi:ribosome-associated translation inhibitor RaiA|nr:HPF/RaiA family ribosome-associated protein [Candidatus Acidoferrum sp.]